MSADECKKDSTCELSFDEAPSKVSGSCTHLNQFRGYKTIVTKCKSLDHTTCLQDSQCEYYFNEMPSNIPNQCTHTPEVSKSIP